MILEEVYNYIFPLGSVDNNNRYINMATDDIVTVQLLEPMVSVTEFLITKKDRLSGTDLPDRLAFRLPVVSINDFMLNNETITSLCVDYSSFVPSIMVEFVDMNNDMLSTNSLRDGSIIKIYIGGNGDELYYKPIRQDFIITDIIKLNSGLQNLGEWIQYRITGSLNVPMGHRKDSWSNNPATSMQELFNLAIYTGLGFATNFTYQTIDKMKWINTSGGSFFEFMRDIAEHACYSPNTFFTAFVDQYYVLNFVECHSLLSHGGKKTDTPAMIYPNIQDDSQPNVDKSPNNGENKETSDQIDVPEGQDPLMNKSQKLSYYFITNHNYFDGWSNFIESYTEISDGYASMNEGYQKHLVYSDSNTCQWGSNSQFNIRPIDNLKRDDLTQQILPLDNLNQETYIPSNLMQTNNSDYESGVADIDLMSGVESYVNLGEVDTSNMYKQYYFAEIQNQYQMRCMKKCGLNVTLQNYNPAITKFSRIWVDIYDMNPISSQAIKPTELDSYYGNVNNNKWLQYKESLNENIITYEDEGFFNNETTAKNSDDKSRGKDTNIPRGNYNRSLSGWYVVTEMKITYDNFDKNMKTHLVLNRIEHKPTFKSEYKLAKSAIDKYKVENRAECIFGSIDDYSYSNDTPTTNNNSDTENTQESNSQNENNQGNENQGGGNSENK